MESYRTVPFASSVSSHFPDNGVDDYEYRLVALILLVSNVLNITIRKTNDYRASRVCFRLPLLCKELYEENL